MTLNDETFAVCLDCGKRISYDLQPLRNRNPWGDNPDPTSPRARDRAPALALVASGSIIEYGLDPSSGSRRLLAKGLGIVIGECGFAVNGPFLFSRFGLSVPEAAVLGSALGAAVGYVLADFAMRLGNRTGPVSPAQATTRLEVATELDYAEKGASASVPADPGPPKAKERLIETLPFKELVRQRANQLFIERGKRAGSPLDDWLRAEEEILRAHADALIDEASEGSFPASDPPACLAAFVID